MGKSPNSTTVQEVKGQVSTTIPRSLAAAMGIKKGTKLMWRVTGAGKLELLLV